MIHLEVAIAAPLEHTLTYGFPSGESITSNNNTATNCVGRRVFVPLGQRKVTGYVVAVKPAEQTTFAVRKIIEFLDDFPLFHEDFEPFFRWVSNYYHYPLGLVIQSALPAGLTRTSVKKLVLITDFADCIPVIGDKISPWGALLKDRGEVGAELTKKILRDKNSRKLVNRLLKDKCVALNTIIKKDTLREKTEICCSLVPDRVTEPDGDNIGKTEIIEYQESIRKKNNEKLLFSEAKTLFFLHSLCKKNNQTSIPLKELRKSYSGTAKALLSLESRGMVTRFRKRVYRTPFGEQLRYYPRPDELTDEQQSVLDHILPAIEEKVFKPFLLHGVTGCGKTEVYLRAAEKTLELGRDVLILVPEIALATQLEAHLVSRFGDLVVLQHSGLTSAERFDQFHLALSGKAKIVIGARSALFAPLKDPGLIVVDEEHDAGFKQDEKFRYHGRDMAVLRARHHGCVVILGSATPSVTSYANGLSKKYSLLTMKSRVGKRSLPKVTLVDLNDNESKVDKRIIKKPLYKRLKNNIKREKQSILLLNRRGFSSVVLCRDCGTPVQCTHCHVSLTLHKGKKQLVCHYCGFTVTDKTTCVECRSTDLVPAGFGTERVEEEVIERFPEARVRRIDSDTASDRKKFLAVLADMHDHKIDILIGTQMIAKGHHFPDVTLVGVVWADGGMSMPDFRAAERTFQLITQVIGRAGRGDTAGDVIIQTMRPDHYAIVYSRNHQYTQLFEHEMRLRKRPAFPPYVRLTALRIQGKVEDEVRKTTLALARFCRKYVIKKGFAVEILGPAPSPLDKIKDRYRWQILLKGESTNELHGICTVVKEQRTVLIKKTCALAIDVDPENMM